MVLRPAACFFLIALLSGCATPPYSARQSFSDKLGGDAVRYGTIAAAGTGGFFLGKELSGGNNAVGAASAAVATVGAYALAKVGDKEKMQAYDAGIQVGQEGARQEIVKDIWTREAVYGLSGSGGSSQPLKRRVYVPERDVNGVVYRGGYQTVDVYR